MKIYVKNMVCQRCLTAVEQLLISLEIQFASIKLGEIELEKSISEEKKEDLNNALIAIGFERIDDKKSQLINQIKTIIIQQIQQPQIEMTTNWSDFIADKLNQDYNYLSTLFSLTEGITIEQYIIRQKAEKIKELLVYDELTINEIAWKLGYSSASHLSNQFKKVTGFSPAHFKKLIDKNRKPIDSI